MSLRVLLATDRALVRAGVRSLLRRDEFTIVSEATNAHDVIDAAGLHRPDVVLLDLGLRDRSGVGLCAAVLERAPAATVIVLFAAGDDEAVRAAVEAGARATIWRDAESLDLGHVVKRVFDGELVFDEPQPSAPSAEGQVSELPRLSERELDVLQLAAQGMTNAEIGARLSLSMNTVKEYLSHAMRKLEVTNRVDAVREATRLGLLEEPSRGVEETAAPEQHELRSPLALDVVRDESRIDIHDPDIQVAPIKIRSLQAGPGPHLRPHPTLESLAERAGEP
jgi:DNA-binding NarL/FixJ family response regulator